MDRIDIPKIKEALKIFVGGLAVGVILATGIREHDNFQKRYNRVFLDGERVIITKTNGLFSYVQAISDGNFVNEVSENSLTGYSKRIRIKPNKEIEKIIEETPNLLGKKRRMEYSIERVSEKEKSELEKRVKKHMYFLYGGY